MFASITPFKPPIIAPLNTLQDGCLASPGLIAAVVVNKYCDHLPLYRQEQIFAQRYKVCRSQDKPWLDGLN